MSVFALAFDFEFPPSNSSFLILIPFKPDGEHLEYFNMPTSDLAKNILKYQRSTTLEFEVSYQFLYLQRRIYFLFC